MRLTNSGMLSRCVSKVQIRAGTFRGWLFLWLVLGFDLPSPASTARAVRVVTREAVRVSNSPLRPERSPGPHTMPQGVMRVPHNSLSALI